MTEKDGGELLFHTRGLYGQDNGARMADIRGWGTVIFRCGL